ncbi:MAG: HRDC domain-containing protein [Candidatus Sericytochromatia bacterium]|nr:HRDC domain-containing protein [Candidatus Sericytochromatia bacterium]
MRELRKQIADSDNIAAYLIFSDATLKEMAKEKPITEHNIKKISGVGAKKFDMYGELFINCIFEFIKRQNDTSVKGSTYTIMNYNEHFKVGKQFQIYFIYLPFSFNFENLLFENYFKLF